MFDISLYSSHSLYPPHSQFLRMTSTRRETNLATLVKNADLSGASPVLRPLYISATVDCLAYGVALSVGAYFVVNANEPSKHGGLGLTTIQVGAGYAAHALSQLIGSFVVNKLSDSTGRKPMLVFAFVWSGIGMVLISVLGFFRQSFVEASETGSSGLVELHASSLSPSPASFSGKTYTSTMMLAILYGMQQFVSGINGGTTGPSQTFIIDVCSFAERGTYLARLGAIYGGSVAAGSLLAGFLSSMFPAAEILMFCAIVCFASAVYLYVYLGESLPLAKRRTPDLGINFASEFRQMNLGVWFIWIAKMGISFANSGLFLIYPFFVRDYLVPANYPGSHYKPEEKVQAGNLYLSIYTCIGAVAQMVALLFVYPRLSEALGKHMTIVFTGFLVAVGLALLAIFGFDTTASFSLAHSFPHAIWKFLLHASLGMVDASLPDALPLYVPEKYLGFSQGVMIGSRSIGGIISSIAVAILFDIHPKIGVSCLVVAAAGVTAFFGLLAKMFCKSQRQEIAAAKKAEEDKATGGISESTRL